MFLNNILFDLGEGDLAERKGRTASFGNVIQFLHFQ